MKKFLIASMLMGLMSTGAVADWLNGWNINPATVTTMSVGIPFSKVTLIEHNSGTAENGGVDRTEECVVDSGNADQNKLLNAGLLTAKSSGKDIKFKAYLLSHSQWGGAVGCVMKSVEIQE